ncbi:hypothetical protein HK104_000556 [Borealophlyctis nickersoniae]|nr:hypothetical protein HK104_000556 [Borealophlyctis nickersoniae]
MDSLGGLHAYQKASLKGGNEKQGKGACGTWVVKFLKREKDTLLDGGEGKLRLLDVGAVSGTTYVRQSSWIDTTSIDLNPQHPRVIKQDFFDRPVPRTEAERFHVVCLSLVVNFVGDVWQRGQMLLHARNHLLPNGLLFLALPLPCITNSRYMTHDRMLAILKSIGFEPLEQHFAKKLAFYLVRKVEAPPVRRWKKEEVNPGPGRNNFCIVLGGGRGGAGGGGT